jgi:hypothetical protein
VNRSFPLIGARSQIGELSYTRRLMGGRAEASALGRIDLSGSRPVRSADDVTAAARFRIVF